MAIKCKIIVNHVPTDTVGIYDLLDDLADLFFRGRYSRREAITVLDALQAQKGGAE